MEKANRHLFFSELGGKKSPYLGKAKKINSLRTIG